MASKKVIADLAATALLALIYFGAGKLGLMLAFVNPSATAVWPPTGIALAAFLLLGNRAWPGVLIGAFFVNYTTSGSAPTSLLIAVGNTLESLIGAYLVRRFAHGPNAFDRGKDILLFTILAGLLSTTVSATIGVTSLALNGLAANPDFAQIWFTWWLGDVGGALLVAPAILLWAGNPHLYWSRGRAAEALCMSASGIFLSLFVFSGLSPFGAKDYALEFILLPMVAWAALRFGQREAASITLILAASAIWGTLHGFGPFARVSPNEALLLLQTFMGTLAMMGIGLATVSVEHKRNDASMQEANYELARGLNEVEHRNYEMALLNEMSDMLQSCLVAEEAYAIITRSMPKLFPDWAGALYLSRTSQNLVEEVSEWGDNPPIQHEFPTDDCWALRRGRRHLLLADSTKPLCNHLRKPPPRTSLCLPMIAHGEILGILHLQSMLASGFSDTQLQLVQAVADSIALAYANLKLRESLRQLSIRDPLTNLFNRRYLEEALDREVRRASRNQTQVGLLLLDIDHFKEFNDRFGHSTGDLLLKELGNFLQSYIRGGDIACRYGGEEFLLLLPDTGIEIMGQRAEEIRQGAAKLLLPEHSGIVGAITISLGISMFPQHGLTREALLQVADSALYQAKNQGRDRVVMPDATLHK